MTGNTIKPMTTVRARISGLISLSLLFKCVMI
jgi:hypothetical protein